MFATPDEVSQVEAVESAREAPAPRPNHPVGGLLGGRQDGFLTAMAGRILPFDTEAAVASEKVSRQP